MFNFQLLFKMKPVTTVPKKFIFSFSSIATCNDFILKVMTH